MIVIDLDRLFRASAGVEFVGTFLGTYAREPVQTDAKRRQPESALAPLSQ
jgi:hypothetical protein